MSGFNVGRGGMLEDSAACTMKTDTIWPAPAEPIQLGGEWTKVRRVPHAGATRTRGS